MVDRGLGKRFYRGRSCPDGIALHDVELATSADALWRPSLAGLSLRRALLSAALTLFVVAVGSGWIGPEAWNWVRWTLLLVACTALFLVLAVSEHFLTEHLFEHVARKHLPRLFLWVLGVLLVLAMGSLFIKGFWCRYFCPYGALLGLFSWMAPVKIRRNPVSCIDCGKCDRVCPSRLPIMIKNSIVSVECTGCMECVEACPVKDTLHLGTRKWKPNAAKVALVIAVTFFVFYIGARVTGHWQTSVTDDAYRQHIQNLNGPAYGHPGM